MNRDNHLFLDFQRKSISFRIGGKDGQTLTGSQPTLDDGVAALLVILKLAKQAGATTIDIRRS